MDHILFRDHRDDHQRDRAQALVPACAAEEQPPQDDQQRAPNGRQHSVAHVIGLEDRDDISEQHEQPRGGDAGPQPKRLSRDRFSGVHFRLPQVR
jgi:hypothetical protein